jgi:hypothetical protein
MYILEILFTYVHMYIPSGEFCDNGTKPEACFKNKSSPLGARLKTGLMSDPVKFGLA